nr:MAG TPA: hypothetical protein [Bacteriophage sp.]
MLPVYPSSQNKHCTLFILPVMIVKTGSKKCESNSVVFLFFISPTPRI